MDEVPGISKHEKIDEGVKLKLSENSADMSYEKSGYRSCPVKLVYIHDGIKRRGGRNVLKNTHYEVFVGKETEDIWLKVLNYIDNNYELDRFERIYSRGWCKLDKEGSGMDTCIEVCT